MQKTLSLFFLMLSGPVLAQTPVTTQPLKTLMTQQQFSSNATLKSKHMPLLSAEVSATVSQIHVDVGDEVKKGDPLVSLDATDWLLQREQAQANVNASQARVQQAQLRLKRAKDLQQSAYISADDLLARETDVSTQVASLQANQAALKIAQRQAEKTTVVAPFDGVITSRSAQKGQWVTVGSPLLAIAQSDELEVHSPVPAHLVSGLAQSNQIRFQSAGVQTPLSLVKITPYIEQPANTQWVRLAPQTPLALGQTGQLIWSLNDHVIPADLLVRRSGQLGVFIAQNGQAQFMPLEQAQEGRPVAANPDLPWQVIVGGRERLQDGDAISVGN